MSPPVQRSPRPAGLLALGRATSLVMGCVRWGCEDQGWHRSKLERSVLTQTLRSCLVAPSSTVAFQMTAT